MHAEKRETGAVCQPARTPRIQAEMAAAKRLLSSGASEIDEALATVAQRLAEELCPPVQETRGDPGVQEEKTPAVVRVVVHRREARV